MVLQKPLRGHLAEPTFPNERNQLILIRTHGANRRIALDPRYLLVLPGIDQRLRLFRPQSKRVQWEKFITVRPRIAVPFSSQ